MFFSEKSVKLFHPIYNDDNTIKIFLSKNDDIHFVPEMEFLAYISVLKKNATLTEIQCSVEKKPNPKYSSMLWRIDNGYINNGHCAFQVVIPQNTMLVVHAFIELEQGVDYIKYNLDENNIAIMKNGKQDLYFDPFNNGLDRNITFNFISDGSVQRKGFIIELNHLGMLKIWGFTRTLQNLACRN